MTKFVVHAKVVVSCFTEVEADSEGRAIEIAKGRELAGLCFSPFLDDVDSSFHIYTDGEPFDFEADSTGDD